MATLEKIRSKSVFLIVVIGVALLAFIVGDALSNSRNIFGDHTTVAKVGSTKIEYTEYQRQREELNSQLEDARRQNPAQFANFDTQILAEMAVEQLTQEKLLLGAAEDAGFRSSGNILRFYMLENPRNPEVMKLIQQLASNGFNVQTPQQAYEIIFNPKRNGLTDAQVEPYQRAWIAAEKETEKQIMMQGYQRLLVGAVRANDLDKKALYNDYVATSNVDLAFLPFGKLDEKKYPVSEQEIKDRYNKDKNEFIVEEPTKEISFIAVNIIPSDEDQKHSKELAEKTVAALNNGGQISKELKKDGVNVSRHSLRGIDIPANIKDAVMSASDSAKLISNNIQGFTAIRVVSRTAATDSVKLNLVSVASEGLGKRVLAALNSGLAVDSVAKRFSSDSVASQKDQWIPLYTAEGETNAIPAEALDSLRNAGGKFVSINSNMVLAQLVEQKAPVVIYEYDEANYVLSPSMKTKNEARAQFEKFLGANNTVEKFNANAAKSGYTTQKFAVTKSTPAVPRIQGMDQYYPESRQVLRWVNIDGEAGEVSHIYNSNDAVRPAMYAVAIEDAYEEFIPVTNKAVREEIEARVRADKAGEQLVKQYSQKTQSLQSAAQAMGVQVRNIPSFRFGRNAGIADTPVIGKIAGSKADKKVVITSGLGGVYVYQVMSQAKESFNYNEQMYEQQYFQFVNPDLGKMLQGTSKVVNNVYKFEAGE